MAAGSSRKYVNKSSSGGAEGRRRSSGSAAWHRRYLSVHLGDRRSNLTGSPLCGESLWLSDASLSLEASSWIRGSLCVANRQIRTDKHPLCLFSCICSKNPLKILLGVLIDYAGGGNECFDLCQDIYIVDPGGLCACVCVCVSRIFKNRHVVIEKSCTRRSCGLIPNLGVSPNLQVLLFPPPIQRLWRKKMQSVNVRVIFFIIYQLYDKCFHLLVPTSLLELSRLASMPHLYWGPR